jgi:hypothetical protein
MLSGVALSLADQKCIGQKASLEMCVHMRDVKRGLVT